MTAAITSHQPSSVARDERAPSPSTTFLDGLRGLAALYVLIHHAALLLHQGYRYGYLKHPGEYSAAGKVGVLALNAFRFGHEAVLFFFVLSGFVIHLGTAKRLRDQGPAARFGWLTFVKRRALRLYPPLIFAIGLTYAVDRVGLSRGYVIYTGGTQSPILNENVHAHHELATLAGNLAFVMQSSMFGHYVPVWGTDAPLWSLKFEWWFYMIYPLFWPLVRRNMAAATGAVGLLYAASFARDHWPVALLQEVFSMMAVWWLGVLLAEIYVGRIAVRFKWVAPLAVLLAPLAVLSARGVEVNALAWGLAFAGLIAAGFAWQAAGGRLRPLDRLKWLCDCSYTLYVCHMPLFVLLGGWLIARSATGELPRGFGWVVGGTVAMVPLAWALHLVVERPFIARRRGGASPPRPCATRRPPVEAGEPTHLDTRSPRS
jgi:peptidoglycan/LPS O-acetylase OafA/YrhL